MLKLSSQIMLDIIAAEMRLPQTQLWLKNQNKLIPNDDKLYITAGIVDAEPYSNVDNLVATADGFKECQTLIVKENVQIDIFSRGLAAAERGWEVLAALHSLRAQQTQEVNSFKIFRLPRGLTDTSSVEGGSQINRYTMIVMAHVWYRKEKPLSDNGGNYYDDFNQRVDDNKSIGEPQGIIEFEINSSGVTTNDS